MPMTNHHFGKSTLKYQYLICCILAVEQCNICAKIFALINLCQLILLDTGNGKLSCLDWSQCFSSGSSTPKKMKQNYSTNSKVTFTEYARFTDFDQFTAYLLAEEAEAKSSFEEYKSLHRLKLEKKVGTRRRYKKFIDGEETEMSERTKIYILAYLILLFIIGNERLKLVLKFILE